MNYKHLVIANLILANLAVVIFPYTITIVSITIAIILGLKGKYYWLMALVLATSVISFILGNLLAAISYHGTFMINLENLKFALLIIPVPLIVNILFVSSFFHD